MAYLGQGAEGNFTTTNAKDTFSGDGSETTFTLSQRGTENNVDVFVNNVRQEPGVAYNIEGNGTSLVFTAAPSTGTNNIYVVNRGPAELSASHPASQNLEAADGTFTGDLTVDTDTLKVDSTNNRVGIGTASSVATLQIKTQTNGNAAFQNSTSVSGGVKINAFNDAANASVPFELDGSTLQFNIAATEKMRIDGSGNVGIGTTSPSYKLHVKDSSSAFAFLDSSGDAMIALDGSNGDFAGGDYFTIEADSNPNLKFTQGGTERMRIQSGGGISFNGDTAAANALDDYEEGTWTPVLQGSTTAGTFSASGINARYIKIGRSVTCHLALSGVTFSGAAGQLYLTGLPFISTDLSSSPSGGAAPLFRNISWTGSYVSNHVRENTGRCEFWGITSGGTYSALQTTNVGSSPELYITFNYESAA